MMRKSVIFAAPGTVVVQAEPIPQPQPGELLVQTLVSAISAGTELLFLRGEVPATMEVDSAIPALTGTVRYPLHYGYACVGRVVETGEEQDRGWLGRLVFAFHPHTSHFVASTAQIIPVPGDLTPHQAALLPNMGSAVNLVMDGQPGIGERVAVIGLGVVGLLTIALLARFPLETLLAVDPLPQRRGLAMAMGAHASLAPGELNERSGYDLVYEVSGSPIALNTALALTGFAGRIVIGSWYGIKQAPLDLGGAFHRSRIRLLASQVSTIDPRWSGRWDKKRRIDLAWTMLRTVEIERLITHRLPVEEAPTAYRLLEQEPERTLQVLFEYG